MVSRLGIWRKDEDRRLAFDILNAAGWKADRLTLLGVGQYMESAEKPAGRLSSSDDPEKTRDWTKALVKALGITRDFSVLAYSSDPEEIKIGETVLEWIRRHRGRAKRSKASEILIRAWDEITRESADR